jgi:hypothetical protein
MSMAFILTIRERNGSWAGRSPAQSTHATEDEARAALSDYVHRNWDAEVGTERPQDADEMIDEYFEEVLEAYEIQRSSEEN